MKCKLCKNAGGEPGWGTCKACGKDFCTKCHSFLFLCPDCFLDALENRLIIFNYEIIKKISEMKIKFFPLDQWRLFWQKGYNYELLEAVDGSIIRMPDLEDLKPKSTSPIDRYIAFRRMEAFYQGAMSGMTERRYAKVMFYSVEYVGNDDSFEEVDLNQFEEREIVVVSFWGDDRGDASGRYSAYCTDGVAYAYYFQPDNGGEGWKIDVDRAGPTWKQGEVFKKKEKQNE